MQGLGALSVTHHTEINLQMTAKATKERCEVTKYPNGEAMTS